MSGRREREATAQAAGEVGELTLLERLALLGLVALIPLRAVISETRTFETPRLFRNLDTPPGAMPATTMAIFGVIVGAAVLVACARLWRGGPRYRWTGAELGIVVLLIAMAISTVRAGQKHLALTGSLDFLGLLLYLLTLRQLLTRPWHVRLVLVTILATGAVVVAKCGYQRWVELPATIRYYEEHKGELAKDADERAAGQVYDFEQRMRSGAVTGYFQHPNVLASNLILVILTSAAMVTGRMSRRRGWTVIAPGIIGLAALGAIFYSQSKGAIAACGLALFIWLVGGRFARLMERQAGLSVAAFWAAFAIFSVVVIATLHARPEALGRSMLFRSFYWQGAASMAKGQGLWGIGTDNFGRHFSRYKAAECPEDVEDPHSWPVKAAVEWGALGLAGLLAVFVGVSWRLARKGRESDVNQVGVESSRDVESHSIGGSIILWTGAIGAIVFGWWAGLLSGSDETYAALVLLLPAICWVVGFVALSCESGESRFILNDPPGPMLAALCAGMIGFLIHTGIDLAMFQGGAATTFFAMMAVALALRDKEWGRNEGGFAVPAKKAAAKVAAVAGIAGLAAFFMEVVRPTATLGAALQEGRTGGEGKSWEEYQASRGYQAYVRAVDAWTLDGTAIDELVEELSRRASNVAQFDFATEHVQMMQSRDPQNASVQNHFAMLYFRRFCVSGDPGDMERSIAAMLRSVEAYPSSPNKRLTLAMLYEQFATRTQSPELRKSAAKELRKALELDAQRIYVSAPNRLSEADRKEIGVRLFRLDESKISP